MEKKYKINTLPNTERAAIDYSFRIETKSLESQLYTSIEFSKIANSPEMKIRILESQLDVLERAMDLRPTAEELMEEIQKRINDLEEILKQEKKRRNENT